jgi:hypothetical protein
MTEFIDSLFENSNKILFVIHDFSPFLAVVFKVFALIAYIAMVILAIGALVRLRAQYLISIKSKNPEKFVSKTYETFISLISIDFHLFVFLILGLALTFVFCFYSFDSGFFQTNEEAVNLVHKLYLGLMIASPYLYFRHFLCGYFFHRYLPMSAEDEHNMTQIIESKLSKETIEAQREYSK